MQDSGTPKRVAWGLDIGNGLCRTSIKTVFTLSLLKLARFYAISILLTIWLVEAVWNRKLIRFYELNSDFDNHAIIRSFPFLCNQHPRSTPLPSLTSFLSNPLRQPWEPIKVVGIGKKLEEGTTKGGSLVNLLYLLPDLYRLRRLRHLQAWRERFSLSPLPRWWQERLFSIFEIRDDNNVYFSRFEIRFRPCASSHASTSPVTPTMPMSSIPP